MWRVRLDFSDEKNALLKEARGVDFKDVVSAIKKGQILDDIQHFNKEKYPKQRIYILRLNEKIYAVPYIRDKERKVIFLKTIYPNRKLKEKYLK